MLFFEGIQMGNFDCWWVVKETKKTSSSHHWDKNVQLLDHDQTKSVRGKKLFKYQYLKSNQHQKVPTVSDG